MLFRMMLIIKKPLYHVNNIDKGGGSEFVLCIKRITIMGSAKRIKADLARWLTLVLIKEITYTSKRPILYMTSYRILVRN